ncbi:hypothetical protein [Ilumatobacter nonamiensis]|uniref:hypothetical protein n=1 Tax=Ilumatobacter nonamiensis TaxID=467093 RepID=UPI0003492EE9|nr:hypothetical protein [Ilumatobacter nonamiensis]
MSQRFAERVSATRDSRAAHWILAHAGLTAAAGWGLVWCLLITTGQQYRLRVLYAGWNMTPYDALVDDPFGSVWNTHIQPPLWNLQTGLIGAWSPFSSVVSHGSMSMIAGCLLAGAICATLVHLGASRPVAWGLTAAATLNTQVLQLAFEPKYDLAVAALLAGLVWSVARLDPTRRDARGLLLPVVIATALVMTRTLYHPAWLLSVLLVIGWQWREQLDRRRILMLTAVPLLVVGGWTAKNQVSFDEPALSSWTGMNLLRSTAPVVGPDRIAELRDEGVVSDVAATGFFRFYDEYAAWNPTCDVDAAAHPALAEETRDIPDSVRTGGVFDAPTTANYNYRCYLAVYDQAGSDALALMVNEPGAWFTGRVWALNNWYQTPSASTGDTSPLWRPMEQISRVMLLSVGHPGLPDDWDDDSLWVHRGPWSITIVATTVALLLATIRVLFGGHATEHHERRRTTTLSVASMIVIWTTVVGIVAELGEQERFRAVTDPIVIALGGLVLLDAFRTRRVRRRVAKETGSTPAIDVPSTVGD